MKLICHECKHEFEVPNWKQYLNRKFCSVTCSTKHNKNGGNTSSLDNFIRLYGEEEGTHRYKLKSERVSKANIGRKGPMTGKHWSEEHKQQVSDKVKQSKYHLNIKGKPLSIEKKNIISKKLKGIHTHKWFKEKYGEEEGTKLYLARCENISQTCFFRLYNKTNKLNYSKISQELFWILYKELSLQDKRIYFGELNHEYGCSTNTNFDFVDVENKKIIEFNGDMWHGNPGIYDKTDKPNPYNKTITVEEVWERDRIKQDKAIQNGFSILIVWQSEYLNNKNEVIEKCKKFLKN